MNMVNNSEALVSVDREAVLWSRLSPARPWLVLHVKSRQEKALAEDMGLLEIAHYLPLVQQVRFYGVRKAVVQLPLFPGYVFLRGTRDDAYRADRTGRVARIIEAADQEQLDGELRNIHLAMRNEAVLDPYPYLVVGQRVVVRSGPFRSLQGVIADRTRPTRLILQVQMLGAAVSLEIDGALVEAIA